MKLCREYVRRQTRQPEQHLILDGPEPMPLKVLKAIESGVITGDIVTWMEDDDFFAPSWLAWLESKFSAGFEMVGEGNAAYWNCAYRWSSFCGNVRHAALVQTAIHRDLLESAANIIRSFESPFWDTRLWTLEANKFLALPNSPAERRVVGIKGMFENGYSGEHRQKSPPGTTPDPSMLTLFKWIGPAAASYRDFYQRP